MTIIDKAYVDQLKWKIQEKIKDGAKMDIVTAACTDEEITGRIPAGGGSLASFIGAKPDDSVTSIKVDDNTPPNNDSEDCTAAQVTEGPKKDGKDISGIILVRTRIELDGDFAMLLRSEPIDSGERQVVHLDQDILAAHQANVKLALENWHFFIHTVLDALKYVTELSE